MYAEIKALHNTLENENIEHVFEEKYCEDTQLHYAVITFQEEIELFNGHMLKHNFPAWWMQVDGGKMYSNNNNMSSLIFMFQFFNSVFKFFDLLF